MKKKILKIIFIVFGSIIALILIAAIIAPPIAHRYIEKHSKEICNRVVKMDKLKANILTGKAKIINFTAWEENDKDVFLTFDTLSVQINLFRLLAKEVRLNEIRLIGHNLPILQNGNRFNFTDIIEHFSTNEPDTTPSSWAVDLRHITIKNGHLLYKDLQRNSKFDLKDMAIYIPGIYFGPENTNVGLNLKFSDGGELAVKLLYALEKKTFDLSIKLKNFEIASIEPYVQEALNINNLAGRLTTDLQILGNTDHILDISAQGKILLQDVKANNDYGETIAQINRLAIDIQQIDIPTQQFNIDSINIEGLLANMTIQEDFNTFSNLVKTKSETEKNESDSEDSKDITSDTLNSEKPSFNFNIKHLALKDGAINYTDHTLKREFKFPVSQINLRANDLDFNTMSKMNFIATLPDGGKIMANWNGILNGWISHELNLHVSNLHLTKISPYCEHYLAYPITDGIFVFTGSYIVKNEYLNSKNEVDIHNCMVGSKMKDIKPEVNTPLRVGLFLLKDREDNIKFDLPVKGHIKDPNFSFRKLIWKAFVNLIVKVAAAPIDLMSNAFGLSADNFKDMSYDIFAMDFTSEQYEQFKVIAEQLKDKENLSLSVTHHFDLEQNAKDLAVFMAKKDYYYSIDPDKDAQKMILSNIKEIEKISVKNKGFVEYLKSKNADIDGDIYQKAFVLHDSTTMIQLAKRYAEMKTELVRKIFVETNGYSADKIEVNVANEKQTKSGENIISFSVLNTPTDAEIDAATKTKE